MLDMLDAVLVDVRFSPNSELMRWRQVYLKTLLREKYHHVPQLGTRAFRDGRANIHNLELGIKVHFRTLRVFHEQIFFPSVNSIYSIVRFQSNNLLD